MSELNPEASTFEQSSFADGEDASFVDEPTNDIPIIDDDEEVEAGVEETFQESAPNLGTTSQIDVPIKVARNVENPTKAANLLGISPEEVASRNDSNSALLRLMEGTIGEIMNRLMENDQLITQIANTVMMLKESMNKCNLDIAELRENLKTNIPDSVRKDYEDQITSLQKEKDETREMIKALSAKMREVNAKVKAQSDQLNMIKTAGSPKKDYQKKLNKLKGMKRGDLEKIAKKWGLYPASYPRKSDLVNAIQLVGYASMLKLNKRPKEELVVLAKNLGVRASGKRELVDKLQRKMSSVKL